MAIVQSFGALQDVKDPYGGYQVGTYGNYEPSYNYIYDYAYYYRTQVNVRVCCDFLARNLAQIGYKIYRRVSENDRQPLPDHPVMEWLEHPNPYTTRYRLFESLIGDLALYFNAYWLKVRVDGRIGLVRLPPQEMRVEGGLLPLQFVWTVQGEARPFAPSEIVYFNGYNPLNALMGLSPIETLLQTLGEDMAAVDNRQRYWRNAARMEGVIERPATAPKWSKDQKQQFREQWAMRFSGPQSMGQVPVLEEGMTWKPISHSARDSEYSASRQFTREECGRAWHIPLTMIGILEHATFTNISDQHKQLYVDTLGPWNTMVNESLELQLLPESTDVEGVYGEFNIAEKLRGSFEEQSNALRVAVGRPFMTANEARARLNLPPITNDASADQLASQQGGTSPLQRTESPAPFPTGPKETNTVEGVVRAHWMRQASRLARLPVEARAEALHPDRCTGELADDLTPLLGRAAALAYAARVTDDTYTLLLEGREAFARDRTVRVPPLSGWWEERYVDAA